MMGKKNVKKEFLLEGFILPDGEREVMLDGKRLDISRSLKVWSHSPSGFNWGYDGSGPAQLALAVALEVNNGNREGYQEFKSAIIAAQPGDRCFKICFNYQERTFQNV